MTKTNLEVRFAVGIGEVKGFNTQQLRDEFLVKDMLVTDEVNWVYSHYERFMVGGAMPVYETLTLDTHDELKTSHFLERRELGIINIGGGGKVNVDGTIFELGNEEALYLGKGNKQVAFSSNSADKPAKFYLNSTPAHHSYPNKKIGADDANVLEMGSQATSNERNINQLVLSGIVQTCQLQMGLTRLKEGSVWNTMPPHQHNRRNEVYFYLDVPEDQTVCHFMGQPQETRHIFVTNEQAVVSPPWSIHCGCGTSNYAFIWGMAGENLDYTDMDHIKPSTLK